MKKETAKYQIANLIRYIGDAFFYPFYALFLSSIGKTESEIGIVLMILPLISLFSNPIWSLFAKNVNYNKKLVIIFTIVEAIAIVSLLAFTNLITIIIITIIIGAVNFPFYTLFESFTTVYTIESGESYSKIRLFGSLGYAIGVVVCGALIKLTGKYVASFFTIFGLYMIVVVLLLMIKPLKTSHIEEENKTNLKQLLANKNYVYFLVFYIIAVAALFSGDSFLGVYFKSRGIDESQFGMISLGVYSLEVVFLLILSKYGEKMKATHILALISFLSAVRFLIYGLNAPFWLLVIGSFLRGFIMAAMLYIVVRHLSTYVRKENITLGMIIFTSLENTFRMVLILSGGFLIEKYNYNVFYVSLGIIVLLSGLFIDASQKKREVINLELEKQEEV
ncbi:MAG TPA: MFS transporter [Acholeplasma sp.]|jgi:MFS family permease|nr:MFS transporter [Acholeplasma sp.]